MLRYRYRHETADCLEICRLHIVQRIFIYHRINIANGRDGIKLIESKRKWHV